MLTTASSPCLQSAFSRQRRGPFADPRTGFAGRMLPPNCCHAVAALCSLFSTPVWIYHGAHEVPMCCTQLSIDSSEWPPDVPAHAHACNSDECALTALHISSGSRVFSPPCPQLEQNTHHSCQAQTTPRSSPEGCTNQAVSQHCRQGAGRPGAGRRCATCSCNTCVPDTESY